ncbi:putative beta-1,2-n-acetylglucosaminyltransferase II [Schistosoma mansoni]|uniref:Alpha-1,6-mannosyl-glycoprotein 2-beta-N-acetylglucosaminyltransferase n=1 Tax=Schistosoma mansoni TaxID=6183 RepID=G4VAB4_SCHMA|nr:putative beta-1,2-n-acetylglucosaminyltransferase II [Schistosoma mansoni]|eukprot:XP_018648329.1 putative beta-1,2-n-acetylglucosaminyltransferase II [Schistosoma mansoni]
MHIKVRWFPTPFFLSTTRFMYRQILIFLSVLLVVLLLMLLLSKFRRYSEFSEYDHSNAYWLWKDVILSPTDSLWLEPVHLQHPKNIRFVINKSSETSGPLSYLLPFSSISNLRQYISHINMVQYVKNEDLYGQLPTRDNFNSTRSSPNHVIIIQVHNRSIELSLLIESLRRTKGIETALIIFSHDFYSDELNSLIGSIRFTRTVQIFYPHSMQIFPDTFPGTDPRDCDSRIKPAEARNIECLNARWPDTFQHYRESHFTQIKNHWLWKIEFVMNHFYPTKYYEGYFILLEEDHFVVEDILHVSELISKNVWSPLKTDGIIALGSYDKDNNYLSNVVELTYWLAPKHNMGMAVSRVVWKNIEQCLNLFCFYDDYNWDWSLQYIGQNCFPGKLKALTLPLSTRVFHSGECRGLHHQKTSCSTELLVTNILQMFSGPLLTRLYPTSLHLSEKIHTENIKQRVNGGWSDERDRSLCQSLFSNKWNKILTHWAPKLIEYSPIY